MSFSLNKFQLIGNLGKDPDIRRTTSGDPIANFSIATSDSWVDKSGQRQERVEWHRVVIFNKYLAATAEKHLRKGSKVYVEGKIQTKKWTDNAGLERFTMEVIVDQFNGELILLDRVASGGEYSGVQSAASAADKRTETKHGGYVSAVDPFAPSCAFDDSSDIPF